MKKLYVICILLAITVYVAHSQQISKEYLQGKVQKFKHMKSSGLVMIISGTVSTTAGIVLISNVDWETSQGSYGGTNYTTNDSDGFGGILLTGVGLGLIGGGIAMTVIGDKKSKKYVKQLEELTIIPMCNPNMTGLMLAFRF